MEGNEQHGALLACVISGILFALLGSASFAILWAVNWWPWRLYRSCSVWSGDDLLNLQQYANANSNGKTVNIRLAASELPDPKSNKTKILEIVIGSVVGVLILGFVAILIMRKTKKTSKVEGSLIAYAYRDLVGVLILGLWGGGFGSVFKGTLPNSTVIAVKKLESISQGEKQFRAEVSTIRTVQHVNLVQLRGFCSEGDKKLLVYDYMSNGSLDCSDSRGRFGR